MSSPIQPPASPASPAAATEPTAAAEPTPADGPTAVAEPTPGSSVSVPAGPAAPAELATSRPALPSGATRRVEIEIPRTPDGIEMLMRARRGAFLGGVARGVADHLGVPVVWVRAAFALLAIIAGAGLVAYALLWIFVPLRPAGVDPGEPASPRERRQAIGIAAVGIALAIVGAAVGLNSAVGWVLGPLGLAAVGAAFIWREADDTRRARWRRSAAGIVTPGSGAWWRPGVASRWSSAGW